MESYEGLLPLLISLFSTHRETPKPPKTCGLEIELVEDGENAALNRPSEKSSTNSISETTATTTTGRFHLPSCTFYTRLSTRMPELQPETGSWDDFYYALESPPRATPTITA